MGIAKKLAVVAAGGAGLLAVAGLGGFMWVNNQVTSTFETEWTTHQADFPIPFPLTEQEVATLRAEYAGQMPEDLPDDVDPLDHFDVDLDAIALERAIARGDHYLEAVYACQACHGANLGGGSMLDDGVIGRVYGPNLTSGGKTADYTAADWDRSVRHGVLPNGKTSVMPVLDYAKLTDRELSDIISAIRAMPAQEGGETVREWGPMGKILIATGSLIPDVEKVEDHHADHVAEPPPVGATVEYGAHIGQLCVGCHRTDMNGGPMAFGPPDWPAATNLTPHADGIAGWTYEDFEGVFRRGLGPDGEPVLVPMAEMLPFTTNMTDTEVQALWAYLESLPATPTGE